MRCTVLKPFDLSTDGIKSARVTPADGPVEVRDDLVAGLVREGFVVEAKAAAEKPAAPKPDGVEGGEGALKAAAVYDDKKAAAKAAKPGKGGKPGKDAGETTEPSGEVKTDGEPKE